MDVFQQVLTSMLVLSLHFSRHTVTAGDICNMRLDGITRYIGSNTDENGKFRLPAGLSLPPLTRYDYLGLHNRSLDVLNLTLGNVRFAPQVPLPSSFPLPPHATSR